MPLVVPLGLLAGLLTTLAGMGGGIVLLLALSLSTSPQTALAVTAPALLLSNLHRAVLFRRAVDRTVAAPLIVGTVPGSVVGGLLLPTIPALWLQGLMLAMTALSLARALGVLKFSLSPRALGPAGFVMGALSATSGGAGLLLAPVLLTAGLSGDRYVATTAAIAVAMHVGRVVAYGATGLVDPHTLAVSAVLLVALLIGNALGARLRPRLTPQRSTQIEYGTLLVAVVLSVAGLH